MILKTEQIFRTMFIIKNTKIQKSNNDSIIHFYTELKYF